MDRWVEEGINAFKRIPQPFFHLLFGLCIGWLVREGQPIYLASIASVLFFVALSKYITEEKRGLNFPFFMTGFQISLNLWMLDLKNPPGYEILRIFGLFLVLFFSLWIAAQFWVCRKVLPSKIQLSSIFGFIGLITLFEWHRLAFFCGYNFYHVSYLLDFFPRGERIFAFFGVHGATFLVLAAFLPPLIFPKKRSSYWFTILFICSLFTPLFTTFKKRFKVGILHTDLQPWGTDEKEYRKEFSRLLSQVDGIDLLVLSETSVPGKYFFDYPQDIHSEILLRCLRIENELIQLSFNKDIDIVVGHIHPGSENKSYNSATLIHKGNVVGRYDKMRLLSVMESKWDFLPEGIQEALDTGHFEAGRQKVLLQGKYLYGFNICYDDYFGGDCHPFGLKGADLILSMHNDVWVDNPFFRLNHFRQSRLRGVENGIPSIRSANGGLSGFCTADGRQHLLPTQTGIVTVEIPLEKNLGTYPYFKDRLALMISLICVLSLFSGMSFEKLLAVRRRP